MNLNLVEVKEVRINVNIHEKIKKEDSFFVLNMNIKNQDVNLQHSQISLFFEDLETIKKTLENLIFHSEITLREFEEKFYGGKK